MSNVKRRSWSAFVQTADVEVRGQVITYQKQGTLAIGQTVCSIPVLGDLIESVVTEKMKNRDAKIDGATLKAALTSTAQAEGAEIGAVARQALVALPSIVSTVLANAAVMADEEEREEFRTVFLASLDLAELFDQLACWIKLNFPQAYGPFVEVSAKIVLFVDGLGKAAVEEEPAQAEAA